MAESSSVQRAELLADLGRYEEAAAELADTGDEDVAAQTLLARVMLAAGKPRDALRAADAAVAAAPRNLSALIARGMVLADLGRGDEAAAQAEQILREGAGSGYACTSAAAILADVRNGQVALNAAWRGVRLTPDQPRAHLVLGVVAAGLGLQEIATRAYQEALTLDPRLPVAQAALGVARLEQLRYAQTLSRLTGQEGPDGKSAPAQLVPTDPDRPPPTPPGVRRASEGPAAVPPVRAGGSGPSATGGRTAPTPRAPGDGVGVGADGDPVVRGLTALAWLALLSPLWVLWAHVVGIGANPTAVLLAVVGLAAVLVAAGRCASAVRRRVTRSSRQRRVWYVAIGSPVMTPLLLVLFVATSSAWPLLVATTVGLVSLAAALFLRRTA